MAEVKTVESDMLVDSTESDLIGKTSSVQDSPPKQNGVDTSVDESNDEKIAPLNGVSNNHTKENPEQDSMQIEVEKPEDKPLENGDTELEEKDVAESVKASVSDKHGDTPVETSGNSDSMAAESKGNSSPVVLNSDASRDGEDSSEVMEVDSKDDEHSNIVEVSSNVSAPISEVVEVDNINSENPSLISEDSSRDSVESNASVKSVNSSESKQKDGLVGTVKGDDGDEILITLNDEEEGEKEKNGAEKEKDDNKQDSKKADIKILEKAEGEKAEKSKEKEPLDKTGGVEASKTVPTLIQPVQVSGASSIPAATTLLFPVSAGSVLSSPQSILVQGPVSNVRSEYQLIRQGNQLGYITVVGSQRLFVPVTSSVQTGAVPKNAVIATQLSAVQQQSQKKDTSVLKPEDLLPKASWEMIELMRWEIQNRVPDNYNWAVAFSPRKEEISSITSFLQELGSDVVKEQVYKDIIQIQTKKKEAGDLKEPEIESLEKMKTVYENTKKKVEHLQLETKDCETCKFKTESSVVMNYHKDFPHYDPPWDTNKGWLLCAHCDFKTKTPAHFIFHQKDIHNIQAKFLEKNQYFHCSLCPLSVSTKGKLEKHQQKCMKHFKLNANLQPYFHDVNFCMKTCYYKLKKVVVKPPPPPPPKPVVSKPTMLTRQQGTVPVSQPIIPPNQAVRPSDVLRQRLPVVRSQMPQQAIQRPQIQPPRPRLNPPALQRAPVQPQQRPLRPAGREMSGFEVCELCGGYVKDRQALRIHFYYAHKVEMPQAIFNRPAAPLTCDVCKQHFWTTQGLTKHKTAQRHFIGAKWTPSVGGGKITSEQECFMCLKKFPNLFVHFERVHGMTMKDLVLVRKCIMCGLAASDYKALETHLVNTHGVLIKVNDYIKDRVTKPANPQTVNAPTIGGGKNVGKINYCVFCQIQFQDNIQLTMHCIRVHATCSTCGMVVATNKNLSTHSCNKAHMNRSCYICGAKVDSQEKYASHLRSHVKPCRVKIQNMSSEQIDAVKNKIKREYKPAVISLDSDEDSDVEVVETKPSKMKVVLEKEDGKDVEMIELCEETDEKSNKETEKKHAAADSGKSEEDSESKASENKNNETNSETEKSTGPKDKGTDSAGKENSEGPVNVKEEDNLTTREHVEESKLEVEQENKTETADNSEKEPVVNEKVSENTDESLGDEKTVGACDEQNTVSTVKTEKEFEDKLLEKGDDEDSGDSSGSRKRKKSDSDIDEDELLRDETSEVKRVKIDSEPDNEQDGAKSETANSAEDCSVEDVEMDKSCVDDNKDEEI